MCVCVRSYSSVSRMGFILTGIGSITATGINGAILRIISHGFIGAALFSLVGMSYDSIRLVFDEMSYDRIRLVYFNEMG